jgi:hypothetical protein
MLNYFYGTYSTAKVYTANSFNPSSNNLAFEDSSLKLEILLFTRNKVSSMKKADHRDKFIKASKSVCMSTICIS